MDPIETTDSQAPQQDSKALGLKLFRQYQEARKAADPTNKKAREHRDMYDGEQWDAKQKAALGPRPPVVINRIAKGINNVSGKQRDARLDFKALPMGKDDILAAHLATRGLDYMEEASQAKFTESEVFLDAIKGPCGWGKVVYDDSDPTKEEIQFHLKSFDEVLGDPYGKLKDMSDWRYVIELRDVDLDVAIDEHPQHENLLRELARNRKDSEDSGVIRGDYDNRDDGHRHEGTVGPMPGEEDDDRQRVLLREHHFWKVEEAEYWEMPNGDKWDKGDPSTDQQALMMGGQARSGRKRCFYRAICAGKTVLESGKSDAPFSRFPYVALWAYRDRQFRPYGIIHNMVWAQKEQNVARSRVNESMRSRHAIVKKGSLTPGELDKLAKDLSRANFIIEVNNPSDVLIGDDKSDVMAWLNIEANAAKDIDDVAGLNEAAYGDKSNEKSGKAIDARVHQQSLNLGEVFDNWRLFRVIRGKMMLAYALARWSPEKWARVAETTTLQQHQDTLLKAAMTKQPPPPPADLSWIPHAVASINSLMRFDVKLIDQAETTSERNAAMDQAIQLTGLLPDQAKAAIAPDIIRMSDFPGAEEMASKAEQALAPPPMPPMPMQPPQAPPAGPDGAFSLPPGAMPPAA
jgi:hypothetical protein